MVPFKKYFTPQEANKRLPLVKKIVGEILSKGQKLKALLDANTKSDVPVQANLLKEEIEALIMELEELGCFYKDWNFEMGLVDFPALIEGEAVFLCWRSDENTLGWYHPVQEGYGGRRAIPAHLLN